MTDSNRRQFVIAPEDGQMGAFYPDITDWGGSLAGATRKPFSFDANRHTLNAGGTVSSFRNRLYDQATGRWAQEDPIGVAGGLNLYQFNGNNPVAFTDPFGLSPCSDLRDEIDEAASDLDGYVHRYLEHYAAGDADAGHKRQIDSRRDKYNKKMKEYRHKKCHEKETSDQDDWMDGSGGAGAAVHANSILLPAPQSDKSDHGRGDHRDMTNAAGAAGAGFATYVIVRTLLRFLVPVTNLVPVVP